jgi:SAM-dependent methyltransferase
MKEAEIRPQALFNEYLELARRDSEALLANRSSFVEVACPACGSKDSAPGLEKHGYVYVECRECRSLYLSPRPSRSLLDSYYREAESVRFWSTHFYSETESARREKIYKPRADLVRGLLVTDGGAAGTFVDIGAGYGVFLEEIARLELFGRTIGLEPNPELAAVCRARGFRVIEKSAEAVADGEIEADFATSFEVLEHVFDPAEFLSAAARLLSPGGRILCTTLTVDGFDVQVLWERSKSVHPPHHINLMSVAGLRRLVRRAGLELADLSTPGQLDVDIVSNMIAEDPALPVPRFVRMLLDGHARRQAFQQFLAANGLSSHVRFIAERPR